MDKMGELVSPLDLLDGGSKGLHGVSTGVLFSRTAGHGGAVANRPSRDPQAQVQSQERIFFRTLDAGLVVWGDPDPFPTPIHEDPDMEEGASFLLYDNIWNTNYVFWWPYEVPGVTYGNIKYRFSIKMVD